MTASSTYNGIKPLHDRVLLRMDEEKNQSKGGIFLPQNREEKPPHRAKVLAIGPGYQQKDGRFKPLELFPGQTVIITPYQGHHLTLKGEKIVLVKAEYILAIEGYPEVADAES